MNPIPTANAAFMATQYYKSGDPMYDIPLTILITIVMGLLGTLISDFTQIVGTKISTLWKYFKTKFNDIIFGKQNTIIIEHIINNQSPDINNKLLIDAIRYNFSKGRKYQLDNKEIKNISMNEHNRESDRVFLKKIDETYTEDGITVIFDNKTMKVTTTDTATKPNQGSVTVTANAASQMDDVPYKEVITLTSYKSISEIEKFIKNKRQIYIDTFCFKDIKIGIYPVFNYGKNTNSSLLTYHKVGLDSNKTFDNWFHPDKQKILKTIDNFQKKTGPFSLKSCQNKLGILLYGLPGCGKTSFIKALAAKLDRSIFPISLDKLGSSLQLRDLFYNNHVSVYKPSKYDWEYVPLNKRIIVFEDIDTAGPIVMDRNKLKSMIEDRNKNNLATRYSFIGKIVEDLDIDGKKPTDDAPIDDMAFSNAARHSSGITLGDLLNLFDGLCELKDLVYVMTTNHIEYLDDALIRPGRITLKLEMTKMITEQIIEMLSYYYLDNNIYQRNISKDELITKINEIAIRLNNSIEASKLEQYCNNNSFEELYELIMTG